MTASAKKTVSYLIKATILVLAGLFIYNKFLGKNDSLKQFEALIAVISRNQVIYTLLAVVLLMAINWFLESLKWQYLAKKLTKISIWVAVEAVFCGLTWAVFTPNRIGEYGGRVMFLPNRKRIHGVFAMAVGAFAQNVITNLVGITASLWFIYYFLDVNIWLYLSLLALSAVFLGLFLVFYFNIKWLVGLLDKIGFLKKYHRFFEIMGRYNMNELLVVIGYSLARFFVFSFQYYLIIHLLLPTIPFAEMMLTVFVFLFIQSAIPSLDLLDIGVRSFTAMHLFLYITNQQIAIIAAVSCIWLINLIIPAIIGSVFVFKMKFF
ncbi:MULTISPECIES: lysylphosphatidylglycerol synthase domain-containing protein [unclassified Mucilaginibacter]|uniref:lysylphosphatidylglycerol synthase domain-containing protein n=1 Tax=unclassified Mucilaginibacter TaxID=2617802 RepID=UPI002AC99325|nr:MULTISPECIES: lysylphosphatidylglycerol synthase domain-containing protein [unclassified Mucilaginibacter]MEB0262578.1 lysylphosphatidylglycerol synthase domain-containing protein [Mucilaginibacter sp. 10I4]MEB0278391.1 lysylphosphatidylglycerol synthase domain-containing protein [Mucilaginibacter sp. 10B2]MEB0303153.1 lysylphosphatidylglycerol synthase domain-containing protein [Mucilaginibacter sp. 5C4]WPX24036.1 lysylphosphatidylglycerol synthase domain-containing protein [Mucilaginibacte